MSSLRGRSILCELNEVRTRGVETRNFEWNTPLHCLTLNSFLCIIIGIKIRQRKYTRHEFSLRVLACCFSYCCHFFVSPPEKKLNSFKSPLQSGSVYRAYDRESVRERVKMIYYWEAWQSSSKAKCESRRSDWRTWDITNKFQWHEKTRQQSRETKELNGVHQLHRPDNGEILMMKNSRPHLLPAHSNF